MGEIKVLQSLINVGQCNSAYKDSLDLRGLPGGAACEESEPSFCALPTL